MPDQIPGFVITGPPRTKKTHSRIIHIPRKGAPKCRCCGHQPGFPKLLPSEAYEIWEESALQQAIGIKRQLAIAGVSLPLIGLLSVEAHIYRETNVGDVCGFQQAIGDMLQKAGIITNDVQIEDFDGTRRLKDAANPRVEIFITVVEEKAVQESLPLRNTKG